MGWDLSTGVLRATVALIAVIALFGCSTDPKAPRTARVTAPNTTAAATTTTAPTPTTAEAPKPQLRLTYAHTFTPAQKRVAEGYFAAEQAHLKALEAPTRDPKGLANSYTGAMLNVVQQEVRSLASKGQAVRLPPDTKSFTRVDGVRLTGKGARLDVCSVDDAVTYERNSGRVVNPDVISQHRHAQLRLIGRHWRLEHRNADTEQEGGVACD